MQKVGIAGIVARFCSRRELTPEQKIFRSRYM
jgi:hypothetical protein